MSYAYIRLYLEYGFFVLFISCLMSIMYLSITSGFFNRKITISNYKEYSVVLIMVISIGSFVSNKLIFVSSIKLAERYFYNDICYEVTNNTIAKCYSDYKTFSANRQLKNKIMEGNF